MDLEKREIMGGPGRLLLIVCLGLSGAARAQDPSRPSDSSAGIAFCESENALCLKVCDRSGPQTDRGRCFSACIDTSMACYDAISANPGKSPRLPDAEPDIRSPFRADQTPAQAR